MDTTYYYDAYCQEYDENYIMGSHVPLPIGTIIKDEDCTSKVLSAYPATKGNPPTSIHPPTPYAYQYMKPTGYQYIGMYMVLFGCLLAIALIIVYNNRTKE
jgi:hypothetical protein